MNKTGRVLQKKNRSCEGYTLYIVLVVLSIAALLFSVVLLQIRYTVSNAKREMNLVQAKYLASSGIERASSFLSGAGGHSIDWETPEYEEQVDGYGTVTLSIGRFGFFRRVQSTGRCRREVFTVSDLFGRTVPDELAPALTLTGKVGGLILRDGSRVEGNIVLHHGYVYRKKGGTPLAGYTARLVFRESSRLPCDSSEVLSVYTSIATEYHDAVSGGVGVNGPLHLNNTNDSLLLQKPLVIQGNCRVSVKLAENAEIIVAGTCTILPGATLRYCSVLAERLVIEGGQTDRSLLFSENGTKISDGMHNSQVISGDSIVVGNKVRCRPMLLLAGIRFPVDSAGNSATGGVYCENGSELEGTILSVFAPEVQGMQYVPSVVLGSDCTVRGVIVTDGDCSMYRCSVKGHVWARTIAARDSSGKYTNFLIGTTIENAAETLVFPLVGSRPVEIVSGRNIY